MSARQVRMAALTGGSTARARWTRRPFRLLIALLACLFVLLLLLRPAAQPGRSIAAPLTGHPAPDFSLPLLGGGTSSLRRYEGHPLLLQFWAVNCESCAAERRAVLEASRAFKARGGVVIGVDAYMESAPVVRAYLRTHPEPYTRIFLDPDDRVVLGTYRVQGVPTSFFLSSDGVIRQIAPGQLSQSAFSAAFAHILTRQ